MELEPEKEVPEQEREMQRIEPSIRRGIGQFAPDSAVRRDSTGRGGPPKPPDLPGPRVEREDSPRPRNNRIIALLLLVFLCAAALFQSAKDVKHTSPPVRAAVEAVDNEIVVDLIDNATPAQIAALGLGLGIQLRFNSEHAVVHKLMVATVPPAARARVLAGLRSNPLVEAADINKEEGMFGTWVPNDPMYQQQWHLKLIGMEEAWDVTKGKGAVVAVIDTGVGLPDKSQYRKPSDFADTKFTEGYDFIEKDKEPEDEQGHGTHVAATIAESTNNGLMGAGVAPEATIMPVRVLNAQGRGKASDIDDGIYFAADHGANVINMSLGGGPYNDVEAKAMEYANKKGVVIVCAAGNDGKGEVSYPAKYKEAIAVSAVGKDKELAYYSNYGDEIDLAGPGGDQKRDGALGGIWQNTFEETPGGFFSQPTAKEGFFSLQGTSMASPHVAGVAALIVSLGIKTPDEVRSILHKSAVDLGTPQKYGSGLLNAAEAVKSTGAKPDQKWLSWGALAAGALIVYIMVPAGSALSAVLTLAVGFFFPVLVEKMAGFGTLWNLAGHSVLVPLIWLLTPNLGEDASRSAAILTFGLAIHFGLDIYTGASPFQVQPQHRIVLWFLLNLMLAAYLASFAMLSGSSHKPAKGQFSAMGGRPSR